MGAGGGWGENLRGKGSRGRGREIQGGQRYRESVRVGRWQVTVYVQVGGTQLEYPSLCVSQLQGMPAHTGAYRYQKGGAGRGDCIVCVAREHV